MCHQIICLWNAHALHTFFLFCPADAYPAWDDSYKKGSFMLICDMLIAEVRTAKGPCVPGG